MESVQIYGCLFSSILSQVGADHQRYPKLTIAFMGVKILSALVRAKRGGPFLFFAPGLLPKARLIRVI